MEPKPIQGIAQPSISNEYKGALQDFQHHSSVAAGTWTFRTIRDMHSLGQDSDVLTGSDKAKILFRGLGATLVFIPVNLIAIPRTFHLKARAEYDPEVKPMPQLHEILPDLYLGTEQAAQSIEILRANTISAVLSILDYEISIPTDQVKQYKCIPIEDYPHVDLSPAIKKAIKFYEKTVKEKNPLLVHCSMGKSRSASIMVALVQHITKGTFADAMDFVETQRPVVDFNCGFKQQLLRRDEKKTL